MVYLVGAGPGDPGLITVKGLDLLRKADVIIHDYLASERLLEHVRSGAETIYVGKRGGEHTYRQEEINAMLLEKAAQGGMVVRLKGGDPFVFGRGGEEAEALAAAGIPFEIVPGVTSAVACPAYAGIPLTHRAYASSAGFVTGHEDPTKPDSGIDWNNLARGVGTLVFLMGAKNLNKICARLMEGGRGPQTPVAIVEWGTTSHQKTTVGTLSTITEVARRNHVAAPAVIIVGEVVELRAQLDWFESKPLFAKTIVVTRAREQASSFVERLEDLGANCLEVPTIEVVPPLSWDALDGAIKNLRGYDWVIFTSANAVDYFLERLKPCGTDIRALAGTQICCIGPSTAERLQRLMIEVEFVPEKFRAEGLVEELLARGVQGKRVLIPRAQEAREILPIKLREAGALVDVVTTYRTIRPETPRDALAALFERGGVNLITFTSSSTVKNFAEIFGGRLPQIMKSVTTACIGPITADTAAKLGLPCDIMPEEYTIPALVEAIVDYFSRKKA
ncbi:MAG: uroporphyrinogen-III C-methyltransferase [Pseudomonadota bacterium]